MSTVATAPAVRALEALLGHLEDAGIEATRDPGAFFPQPVGVLVGLPALVSRGHGTRTFEVAVLVVSGDPFTATLAIERALALADEVALVLRTDNYRQSSWRSSPNAQPLDALELTVTVSTTEQEASP
jgi:hypothetical protein